MKKIAKFHKVSFEQFEKDYRDCFTSSCYDEYDDEEMTSDEIRKIWEAIELPKRSTSGSAGYDFVTPVSIVLLHGEEEVVPTGIRVEMEENWVLKLYPRSSIGFKYKARFSNTVPIIDSDYFYSDNEGHIKAKISNEGNKMLHINAGEKFIQGIFNEYGITVDDDATGIRNGGIGSTGK